MDKYELNQKMEQIKKLAAKKAYKEAAEIANEINWVKVKDWSILATVINVQEAVGDYEEARDAAIIAYNRNLGGKKLVYKLTQLLIKLKQFDEADELYDEYDRMAYRDADRYVLFYELRKAEGAEDSELISILEEYKEQEADEKYLHELAKLYAKHDRKEDCIQLCDDIIMWFQDGEYVENSIKLKEQLGGSLTKLQLKIKSDAQKRKEDVEETKQALFEKQKEIMRIKDDELDEVLEEDELVDIDDEEDDDAGDEIEVPPMFSQSNDISITSVMEAIMSADETDDGSGAEEEELVSKKTFGKEEISDENPEDDKIEPESEVEEVAGDEETISPVVDIDVEEDDEDDEADIDIEEKMSQIPENLQSMINDAKKQIDDKYDRINKEEEQERLAREKQEALRRIRAREDAMAEDVSVPSYGNNIYDTQNIQEALAKNFSEIIDEEEDDLSALRPTSRKIQPKVEEVKPEEEVLEDEQIEGQMNIAEWLENVREEKYGKQHTKQYSRSEVVRFLEDRDEKSAAYDKIVEEKKAAKEAAKVAEKAAKSETEEQIKARAQMMLNAAKMDLAIRTGKATLKLEASMESLKMQAKAEAEAKALREMQLAEAENLKEAAVTEVQEVDIAESTETVDVDTVVDIHSIADEEAVVASEVNTEIKLNTATFEPVTDEVIEAHNKTDEVAVEEEVAKESEPIEDVKQEKAVSKKKSSKIKINNPVLKGQVVVRDGEKKLTGDLAKLFRRYREMPGIETQIIDFLESIGDEINQLTSATGNLIISGNSSSDKIDLARTMVRAINFLYPDKAKKIAKTTGDSINSRGIEKAMPKLMGTALIVEEAGSIQPKRIKEILNCLKQDTDGMIVIFEDSDAEMNVLINFNPDMLEAFNHRIVLKQYTVNELVELARKYANKKQYEVDDDALLELYLKIDTLHNTNENIRLDDIKEIINKAIENAVERNSKKKFGLLMRVQKNGKNYILAQDLKD